MAGHDCADGGIVSARKTAKKSARRVYGRPFSHGADPRRGVGKKGRSGRKPLAFTEECSGGADEKVLPKILGKLDEAGPDDAAWRWCAEYVTGYGKGKQPQQIEVTGKEGGPVRFTLALGEAKLDD